MAMSAEQSQKIHSAKIKANCAPAEIKPQKHWLQKERNYLNMHKCHVNLLKFHLKVQKLTDNISPISTS